MLGQKWRSTAGEREVVGEVMREVAGEAIKVYVVATGGVHSREFVAEKDLAGVIQLDVAWREASLTAQARAAKQRASAPEPPAVDAGFTAGLTDLARGRVLKTLQLVVGFNSVFASRADHIASRLAAGWRVQATPAGVRRFCSPDGSFFTEKDMTKTGMDYAAFLQDSQNSATKVT